MRRLRAAVSTALGSVDHESEMSLVDHLDELRTRLIVALAVVAVAFGLCFWQNHRLIALINAPLSTQTQHQVHSGVGELGSIYRVQRGAHGVAVQVGALSRALTGLHRPGLDRSLDRIDRKLSAAGRQLSAPIPGAKPVTLGIGEPLTATVGVSLIFALVLSLPVILLQIYGFFIPGLEPVYRRRMRPLLIAAPALFMTGVAFGYVVVLPAAVHFLQNFNASQFQVLVQASQYYHFAAMTLLAMGLVFEVPVAVVALTESGAMTPPQLRRGRKFALAGCAALAAFLPGDAITMLLEAAPLYLLYELGILIAAGLERRARRSASSGADPLAAVLRTTE